MWHNSSAPRDSTLILGIWDDEYAIASWVHIDQIDKEAWRVAGTSAYYSCDPDLWVQVPAISPAPKGGPTLTIRSMIQLGMPIDAPITLPDVTKFRPLREVPVDPLQAPNPTRIIVLR
jgi:hypothetical protein